MRRFPARHSPGLFLLGSTVATSSCHFPEAWGFSRSFSVKVGLGPEVRSYVARGHYFYGSSFLAATCSMSFWSTGYGIFWEIPSGNVPVFSAIWLDSGYMFASAHEVLSDKGVDMPVVMQDSLVQTVQRLVAAPQVQFLARLWMCLSLCAAILLFGYGRRCEHAATRGLATVKCLRLSSSPCMAGLVWPAW